MAPSTRGNPLLRSSGNHPPGSLINCKFGTRNLRPWLEAEEPPNSSGRLFCFPRPGYSAKRPSCTTVPHMTTTRPFYLHSSELREIADLLDLIEMRPSTGVSVERVELSDEAGNPAGVLAYANPDSDELAYIPVHWLPDDNEPEGLFEGESPVDRLNAELARGDEIYMQVYGDLNDAGLPF